MSWQLKDHVSIDTEKWNQCVLSSPYFRHYALTSYLNNACENWQALILGDYEAVWPLPIKSVPVKRLFQPLLAQQLGPFGTFSDEDFRDGITYLRSSFFTGNIKFNERITKAHLPAMVGHTNVELSLNAEYAELKKQYNRNVKSNLKKAEKLGLEVEALQDTDNIIQMFQENKGKTLDLLDAAFYNQVRDIYDAFLQQGEAFGLRAVLNGTSVAEVLVLSTHNRLLLLFSASNDKARECGAMHKLIDTVIQQFADTGTILDFEGSNDEGLAYFYESFGGQKKDYYQFQFRDIRNPLTKLRR